MSGILDFLGNLAGSLPGYLADAYPNSIFANVRNSQLARGMLDATPGNVQVTPRVQGPNAQMDVANNAASGAYDPRNAAGIPYQQLPFLQGISASQGPAAALNTAAEYNLQKPMTAFEKAQNDLSQQQFAFNKRKPVFAPPGESGYTPDASGDYSATIQGKQPRPATPDEVAQYGLPPGTPAQINAQGAFQPITQPNKPNPTGPQSDATALGLKPGTKEYGDYIRQRTLTGEDQGWQFLNDPGANNTPYRANARTGQILDLAGKPYTPTGMARLASGNTAQLFTPEQAKLFAQQALAGDRSVFATVGRNSAARTQIAQTMADMAKEQGLNGVDIATINAAFLGDQQAQRTIGTRTGAIAVSGQEAKGVANLVNDAYSKLPRADFRPFNQLRSLYETQTSSPEQAAAYLADFSLQTAYARALNPQGVPRESDIEQAGKLLNGAQSQEAHKAVVDQILKEVGVIQDSTGAARVQAINRIRQERGFGAIPAPSPAQAAQPAAPPQIGGVIRYDAQGRRIK